MNMNGLKKLLVSALGLAACLAAGPASSEDAIKLGIFPRKSALETKSAYDPLVMLLADKTGRKIELILSKDFTAFWESMKKREFDVVHYNQYHYIKSHKELDYNVILMNEEWGSTMTRSAIAVRKDSGINSIADLKGKKLVFGGGKQAMQSYIGAVYLLKKSGLKPGDYTEEFAVSPPNAAMAVFSKMAAAAGIGENVLELASVKQKIGVDQMKLLATGEPLPMLCWAVKKEMDKALAGKIAKTMTDLKNDAAGEAILKGAEVTAFKPAANKDYDIVRKVVKEALGESY